MTIQTKKNRSERLLIFGKTKLKPTKNIVFFPSNWKYARLFSISKLKTKPFQSLFGAVNETGKEEWGK